MSHFLIGQDCSWDNEVCISYCSDGGWNNAGQQLLCGDPTSATIDNPFTLGYCFSDEAEPVYCFTNPFTGEEICITPNPTFLLCVPDDICSGSVNVFKVENTVGGIVETLILTKDLVPWGTTRRQTPCDMCPPRSTGGSYNYSFLPRVEKGKYKVELEYICCEEGNGECCPEEGAEAKTTSFYYEIVDAASEVDIEISYTASQVIETINGDLDIDGLIPNSGGSPGPELGPFSAGINITAVGFGVNSYTVNLFEVDCNSPGSTTLINSETIPYAGSQSITYSFLNVPGWGNINTPNACFKVEVIVESICGTYTDEGFFTITDQCAVCRQVMETEDLDNTINVFPNPTSGIINISSEVEIAELILVDEVGKVILNQNLANSLPTQHRVEFSQKGIFFLTVIDGNGGKTTKIISSY